MKRLLWPLLLLPLVLLTVTFAAPPLPEQGSAALTAVLERAVARGDVPGVVVTVVDRDGVLYHEAFGQSSTIERTPMVRDTIFNMASMTKAITSVAVMMLVDEGKLSIDDEVAQYLPQFADREVVSRFDEADGSFETRPAERPITIRHLLTHTSGIGYGFSSPTLSRIMQATGRNELESPLLFEPGESWAYGASTRVLGQLVEAVSGQPLDAFLQTRILGPLGMGDTGYQVPEAKHARVVAVNTRGADGSFVEQQRPATARSNVAGDGGLYGTAGDYGRFLRMLLNGGRLGDARVLRAATVGTMFENHTGDVVVPLQRSTNQGLSRDFPLGAGEDHWGLGFQLAAGRQAHRRAPGSGTWAGIFNTHFFVDPTTGIGVVVMMQTLPFYDERSMQVYAGVEEAVYAHLP